MNGFIWLGTWLPVLRLSKMAHVLPRIMVLALCGWGVQSVQAGATVDPFLAGSIPTGPAVTTHPVASTLQPVRTTGSAPVGELPEYSLLSEVVKVAPGEEDSASSAIDLATWAQKGKRGWSCGGFKVTPYGAFWADMIYETRDTVPGHFTLFVPSSDVHSSNSNAFYVDMRRSRFGFNLAGPRIGAFSRAKSQGRVEIDFIGDFITANQPKARLRHAYWEVGDEDFRLLVGQTWDIISPLNPGVLNFSVGWMGGNIGFRRAQFRAERYLHPADDVTVTLQGSLNEVITTDFTSDQNIQREVNGWPTAEGRTAIAWNNTLGGGQPAEIGISGHIGETGFDFLETGPPPLNLPPEHNARFRTWSFNVDMRYPIGDRFGLQGEFFTGANLATFLGGVGQGVCACTREPIRSMGGWFDLWYDWTSRLHSHVGYGVDDPNNNDSLLGRSYNQFIFANITLDVTDKLLTGFEVTSWKTLYHEERVGLIPDDQLSPSAPGKSIVLQWMVKYGF